MPIKIQGKEITGDFFVLIAMAIFGSFALFLRFFPMIPVLLFLFAFQFVGAVAFSLLTYQQGFPKLRKRLVLLLVGLTVVAILNDLFYFLAFRFTTVANAAVAHQMVSVFLLFLAPALLDEKTRKSEWVALALSLVGIVVIYTNGLALSLRDVWGITLGLASALCYAFLIILYRYIPTQGLSISAINFWRYSMSTVILLPIVAGFGAFHFTARDILPLTAFGLLFAVIASGIHNFGISKTRSLHVSILGKSEPVFATLYAFLLLHEIPGIYTMIGGALIIGSSIWLAFQREPA